MIEFALVAASVIGEVGLTELVKFLKGNKKQLQKAYEKAFANTVDWYEKTYGNQYGRKNSRFFNHQPAEEEFAKLLLLRPEPDIGLISAIKLDEEKKAPLEVIQAFVNKLRHQMLQIRECEVVLVEREKFLIFTGIKDDTSGILNGVNRLVKLKEKELGIEEQPPTKQIHPDPTPIDWQELEKMFREEYRLDRLDYGHLGTSHRDQLEHKLELQKVYVALNVKDRSFDKITSAAKVKALTPTQYKNLPLLFQRFDDLIHLERERDFKIFQAQTEVDEKQTYQIARKILHECDTNNLRHPNVILKEITTSQRLKPEQALQILALLSNSAIVPRPIAEIPAKERCHLFIGDAGGGKSTACRYMALRCFEDWRNEQSKILAKEFGITGKTPLPIYLRLEDFGKMISEYAEDTLCLFQCAAQFWKHSNGKTLFTAGQLYHALQHQPVWLLLDGLDEISNPENRLKLASVVQKLVKSNAFPQMYLTLTSRPAAINDELLNTLNIPYFTILNLEPEQIESFAHNYFAANLLEETEEQVNQRANELIDALESVPAAKQLTTNPLLLTVIAVLHYKEGKLPQHRAELYEKCIEQLMAQKATTPGRLETGKISFRFPPPPGKPIIDLNHNQIVDMLRDLAFHAHQRTVDEIYLNPELVLQRLRDEKNDFIPPEKKASAELEQAASKFLDECDRLIGLLAYRGGHYVFVHRTFQEYLAAHWLSLQKEAMQHDHLLTMLKNSSHWREVIRLFFNRLGKLTPAFGEELVEQVAAAALEKQEQSLIQLAAECLNDFEEYQRRYRLHDQIKNKIQSIRDRSHNKPTLFLACGDALGLMNEPQIDVFDPPMIFLEPKKPFNMGSEEYSNEKPIHPVQLSPYWIGKYPVTNKAFAEFIKQGGYQNENYWIDKEGQFKFNGRDFLKKELKEKQPGYWLDEKFGRSRPLAPVVGISWYEAMAYCMWLTEQNPGRKFRLPTEAEWEFAARGFEGRRFPWGNTPEPNPELANFNDSKLERTTAVGSYPAGATPAENENERIFDLGGNAWEWCYDWYDEHYYQSSPPKNPKGPASSPIGARVLRGGSWDNNERNCRSANRNWDDPGD